MYSEQKQALAAELSFKHPAVLAVSGSAGSGKTALLATLLPVLKSRGLKVGVIREADDLRLPAELAKLDRFDLLVCDDFSYVRRDQSETSVLFELIAERYERRSMAITANQPFSGWDHVFAEPAMTLAAVDRLVHHSTIFEMNVESFRRRSAQTGLAPSVQSKKPTSKTKG